MFPDEVKEIIKKLEAERTVEAYTLAEFDEFSSSVLTIEIDGRGIDPKDLDSLVRKLDECKSLYHLVYDLVVRFKS